MSSSLRELIADAAAAMDKLGPDIAELDDDPHDILEQAQAVTKLITQARDLIG